MLNIVYMLEIELRRIWMSYRCVCVCVLCRCRASGALSAVPRLPALRIWE